MQQCSAGKMVPVYSFPMKTKRKFYDPEHLKNEKYNIKEV